MKQVEIYARVRHTVLIEGISERAAAERYGINASDLLPKFHPAVVRVFSLIEALPNVGSSGTGVSVMFRSAEAVVR